MLPKCGGILLAACLPLYGGATGSAPLTYYKDVAPILQQRCQGCHRPGEIGPMPLLNYKQVRPWAKAIRSAVVLKKMPPWFADPGYGTFSNDRSLSRAEIDTLVSWADNGAPEGNPKDAPQPVSFVDGWAIGKPDLVLEVPTEYHIPASGVVPYQYILFPSGFTEDKWIEAVEMRPENPSVVHHMIASVRPHNPEYEKKHPHGQYFEREGDPDSRDRSRTFGAAPDSENLQVYVPGGVAPALKPGQARLIKAGSDIMFQLHFTPNGTPVTERPRIGFRFAKQPPSSVFAAFLCSTRISRFSQAIRMPWSRQK